MKERGIIMQSESVRAILAGSKTQTRRIAKFVALEPGFNLGFSGVEAGHYCTGAPSSGHVLYSRRGDGVWEQRTRPIHCPYGAPGDRLLVATPIPSAPNDDYCAGSDGQVYSRTRYVGFGRKDLVDWYPLSGAKNTKGYRIISLCHQNKKVTRTVHSLVCEAFYGPSPFKGAQVRHLDGNSENNEPSNLAWGTQAENWTDRRAQGRGVEGEKHHAAKLTDEERAHVRWAIARGLCSQRHAARALGMSQGSMSELVKGVELRETIISDPGERIPRITLEIIDVRVERLNAISEEDARAEGTRLETKSCDACGPGVPVDAVRCPTCGDMHNFSFGQVRDRFADLWDSLNAERAPWSSNPWVWVLTFKRVTP